MRLRVGCVGWRELGGGRGRTCKAFGCVDEFEEGRCGGGVREEEGDGVSLSSEFAA